MKKKLSMLSCFAILCAGGLALSGCGGMTNGDIVAKEGAVNLGGVDFQNASGFSVEYKGDNNFTAKGKVGEMSSVQANAFWAGVAKEGDEYVVLSVKFDSGSKIVYGFEQQGADFTVPDGTKVKSVTNTTDANDKLEIILRVNSSNEIFKTILTEKDKEAVIYKIDMTGIEYKTAQK